MLNLVVSLEDTVTGTKEELSSVPFDTDCLSAGQETISEVAAVTLQHMPEEQAVEVLKQEICEKPQGCGF